MGRHSIGAPARRPAPPEPEVLTLCGIDLPLVTELPPATQFLVEGVRGTDDPAGRILVRFVMGILAQIVDPAKEHQVALAQAMLTGGVDDVVIDVLNLVADLYGTDAPDPAEVAAALTPEPAVSEVERITTVLANPPVENLDPQMLAKLAEQDRNALDLRSFIAPPTRTPQG